MAYHEYNHDLVKKRRLDAEMDKFEKEISKPALVIGQPTVGYPTVLPATNSLYQFIPHQIQRQVPTMNRVGPPMHTSALGIPANASVVTGLTPGVPLPVGHKMTNAKGFQAINTMAIGSPIPGPSTANQSYTVTPMGLPPGVSLASLASNSSTPSTSGTQTKKGSKNVEKTSSKVKKCLRAAGGQIWEDNTLTEWDPDDFRLFVGDLGNDVTDEVLTRGFSKYTSFVKAKVIRDKRTNKSKGYGFVSFKDPSDYIRAMKEMDGKYLGSRPIKLRKSTWKERSLDIVKKKNKEKAKFLSS